MPKNKVAIQRGQFENVLAVAFAPVVALSELIKNSSDACTSPQDTIKIYIDPNANVIRLIDNGYGFSRKDIANLKTVGYSNKMTKDNTLSRIGEPFAGSKGLGILTAFNLCETLEIRTFSQEDHKAYRIVWKKGSGEFADEKTDKNTPGTELILHGVSDETIKLLVMEEELTKLYLSSITYYVNSKTLPKIELYLGDELKVLTPQIKIDELYQRFKTQPANGRDGYFVAKATFKYSANKLTLSYDDNEKNLFVFKNEEINLADISSISTFLRKIGIFNANFKDKVAEFDSETLVDDFEGTYYIWRNRKHEDMNYPYGVRIYINNYGLYNYLNKNFDWLQHSEISQNVKATNYKLKNTYGFVTFRNYNEEVSKLKISNERNDFHENLAKKKFLYIMQELVSGIFSTIDINIKNFNKDEPVTFKKRVSTKKIVIGTPLRIVDLINTNLSLEEINIDSPSNATVDSDGNISFTQHGRYNFSFGHEEEIINIEILVEDNIPCFELKRTSKEVNENNFTNLEDVIKRGSIRNLNIEDIKIHGDNNANITKGKIFTSQNLPGKYNIVYEYSDELKKTMLLTVKPAYSQKADKLKELFPNSCKKYPKITDIIYAISESYVKHPTLCMISLRPLIEISLKAFIHEFYSEEERKQVEKEINEQKFQVPGKIDGLLNKIRCDQLPSVDKSVLDKYSETLKVVGKKQIANHYNTLEVNMHIHNPHMHATSNEVSQSLKKFHPFLNFIIDALNSKCVTP